MGENPLARPLMNDCYRKPREPSDFDEIEQFAGHLFTIAGTIEQQSGEFLRQLDSDWEYFDPFWQALLFSISST